ncbi:YqgQ family protein [Lederbergia citrea]|uniref:YqgQ family protein n=1 Tax=Lederbergia citrea TaxID=2833581 RepID=A0A942UT34_9BACI|nr:YqgQ family protein [Lederbergia citrea]MBS4222429.1 YqgQ family protein [Lederbergia citrea]
MKTVYDVQQMLKKFGIFVYVGDRIADLELMESEIKELYFSHLITKDELHTALAIIRNEIQIEKTRKAQPSVKRRTNFEGF